MSSICNYSHPELQITTNLTRHPGDLFPYNPDFYSRASGLYGPGAIYCWHLLLASLVINWAFYPKGPDGVQRPGVTNDLLGVLAFPAFAATDGLIQSIKLWGTAHRALAFFCLRYPATDLSGMAKFNHTQLDLNHVPPEILSLGQRIIDLTGPVTVCYTFVAVFVLLVFLMLTDILEKYSWKPTKHAKLLATAGYGYVLAVLVVFHLGLGDLFISLVIALYEALLPFEMFFVFGSSVFVGIAAIGWMLTLIEAVSAGDPKQLLECAKGFGAVCFGACFPGLMIFFSYANRTRLVPDLAIGVTERDQMATLIVGIVSLCFTFYDVWREWRAEMKQDEPVGGQEMQPLATEEV